MEIKELREQINLLTYEDREQLIKEMYNLQCRLKPSLLVRPFDFIRQCDPAHLLVILQQEHPQTIAVVLSYMEPNKASVILKNLSPEIQSNVLRRICCMGYIRPETLREVERVLVKKLSHINSDAFMRGGIDDAMKIMGYMDKGTGKQIIETLKDEDPELAEEIKKRMFVFKDVATFWRKWLKEYQSGKKSAVKSVSIKKEKE